MGREAVVSSTIASCFYECLLSPTMKTTVGHQSKKQTTLCAKSIVVDAGTNHILNRLKETYFVIIAVFVFPSWNTKRVVPDDEVFCEISYISKSVRFRNFTKNMDVGVRCRV